MSSVLLTRQRSGTRKQFMFSGKSLNSFTDNSWTRLSPGRQAGRQYLSEKSCMLCKVRCLKLKHDLWEGGPGCIYTSTWVCLANEIVTLRPSRKLRQAYAYEYLNYDGNYYYSIRPVFFMVNYTWIFTQILHTLKCRDCVTFYFRSCSRGLRHFNITETNF